MGLYKNITEKGASHLSGKGASHLLWFTLRFQLAQNAILNPVLIPPLDGIHHVAIHQHREVQMIAAGESGHSASPKFLFLFDHLTSLDADGRLMSIQRLHAHPVINDDAVAIDAQLIGED